MSHICRHSLLRRSCETCDLEQENGELRELIKKMIVNAPTGEQATLCKEYERATGESIKELCE